MNRKFQRLNLSIETVISSPYRSTRSLWLVIISTGRVGSSENNYRSGRVMKFSTGSISGKYVIRGSHTTNFYNQFELIINAIV